MGIVVHALLWVMQDLSHQPEYYLAALRRIAKHQYFLAALFRNPINPTKAKDLKLQ